MALGADTGLAFLVSAGTCSVTGAALDGAKTHIHSKNIQVVSLKTVVNIEVYWFRQMLASINRQNELTAFLYIFLYILIFKSWVETQTDKKKEGADLEELQWLSQV